MGSGVEVNWFILEETKNFTSASTFAKSNFLLFPLFWVRFPHQALKFAYDLNCVSSYRATF